MVTKVTRMMYVYFNDEFNITGISPVLDEGIVGSGMHYTKFSVDDVRPFITGEKNMNTHYLKADKKDPTKYEIKARSLEVNYLKTIDRFLTEVDKCDTDQEYHIKITNNVKTKVMYFKLHQSIKTSILKDEVIETGNITINGIPELDFFFTAKNDPSFLIQYVCIKTNELIVNSNVCIEYDGNLSYASLFTKKIFTNYVYEVIE